MYGGSVSIHRNEDRTFPEADLRSTVEVWSAVLVLVHFTATA